MWVIDIDADGNALATWLGEEPPPGPEPLIEENPNDPVA